MPDKQAMLRIIFIMFYQLGILWASQAPLDTKVLGDVRVGVVVNHLAAVVKDEGKTDLVREVARVLLKHGENKTTLVREILNLLKKLRRQKGIDKRIFPQGIVRLLKSRGTVKAKRKILEKVLFTIDDENELVTKMEEIVSSTINPSTVGNTIHLGMTNLTESIGETRTTAIPDNDTSTTQKLLRNEVHTVEGSVKKEDNDNVVPNGIDPGLLSFNEKPINIILKHESNPIDGDLITQVKNMKENKTQMIKTDINHNGPKNTVRNLLEKTNPFEVKSFVHFGKTKVKFQEQVRPTTIFKRIDSPKNIGQTKTLAPLVPLTRTFFPPNRFVNLGTGKNPKRIIKRKVKSNQPRVNKN